MCVLSAGRVVKSLSVAAQEKKEEEEVDPTKYYENRLRAITDMEKEGQKAYPHKFAVQVCPLPLPLPPPFSLPRAPMRGCVGPSSPVARATHRPQIKLPDFIEKFSGLDNGARESEQTSVAGRIHR